MAGGLRRGTLSRATCRAAHLSQIRTFLCAFSEASRPVRILRSQPAKLDSGINTKLSAEAERLWRKHATELAPGITVSRFEVSQPRVEHVPQFPGQLAVLYRVKFRGEDKGQSWTDDSATVFFLYSLAQQRILIGTFGHGEWGPGSSVLTIKPVFYFRVGDAKDVCMLAERYGGWEDGDTRFSI